MALYICTIKGLASGQSSSSSSIPQQIELTRVFYKNAPTLSAAMIDFSQRIPTKGDSTMTVEIVNSITDLDS